MGAHGGIVTEAGLLGVVAVRIGIVRRREHRIDDEVGEIVRAKRGGPGQRNARAVGIAPGIVVVLGSRNRSQDRAAGRAGR
jgi:hypothetical protein